jgi:peptidoglycan/xylan/chitin deacetylase (PgdA/CDA1 family)
MWLFPKYIWKIPTTNEKVIYLTFDDGPTPEITSWILVTLKKYNAKATFFCIGNNIEKNSKIFQNVLKDDHSIGNHTHNHKSGWKSSSSEYLKSIKKTKKIIQREVQQSAINNQQSLINNLFRPPYGQLKPQQGKALLKLGYKIIMWTVISYDWDSRISKEQCFKNVISKATNGSIIVFHDSVKASRNMQYALPKVLEYYKKKGYSFKRIPELNQ